MNPNEAKAGTAEDLLTYQAFLQAVADGRLHDAEGMQSTVAIRFQSLAIRELTTTKEVRKLLALGQPAEAQAEAMKSVVEPVRTALRVLTQLVDHAPSVKERAKEKIGTRRDRMPQLRTQLRKFRRDPNFKTVLDAMANDVRENRLFLCDAHMLFRTLWVLEKGGRELLLYDLMDELHLSEARALQGLDTVKPILLRKGWGAVLREGVIQLSAVKRDAK